MSDVYIAHDVDLEPYGYTGSKAVSLAAINVTRDVALELCAMTGEERARLAEDLRCDVEIAIGLAASSRSRRRRQAA